MSKFQELVSSKQQVMDERLARQEREAIKQAEEQKRNERERIERNEKLLVAARCLIVLSDLLATGRGRSPEGSRSSGNTFLGQYAVDNGDFNVYFSTYLTPGHRLIETTEERGARTAEPINLDEITTPENASVLGQELGSPPFIAELIAEQLVKHRLVDAWPETAPDPNLLLDS